MINTIEIGLLGLGNVGRGLVELIRRNASLIEERTRLRIVLKRALVCDLLKARPVDGIELTANPDDLLNDGSITILVEVMGGLEPARSILTEGLRRGKHVVTANKALLATHGGELFALAGAGKRRIGFEASVCGGIPLLHSLTQGLIANEIESLRGILNGTTNFILTRMFTEGLGYTEALALAQEKGFAEPDPTFDVSGRDAAQKLAVLSRIAFAAYADPDLLPTRGIERIEAVDVATAKELGWVIKLIAFGERTEEGLDLRVHPALLPAGHPLANVSDENNAVLVRGDAAGELMFYGPGAGRAPTASAVLADVIDIARSPLPISLEGRGALPAKIRGTAGRYYLRCSFSRNGAMIHRVTAELGRTGVPIRQVFAREGKDRQQEVSYVQVVTLETDHGRIDEATREIGGWEESIGEPLAIRLYD